MLAEDKLVFLTSLPRSGSTLLQSMLSESDDLYTESESWILLQLLDVTLNNVMETVYNKNTASQAIQSFLEDIPQVRRDRILRRHALSLYGERLPEGPSRFLDKTPRYYLISKSLERVFPKARHLYLTRNPIAVLASLYSSWVSKDLDSLLNYQVDLVQGIRQMAETVSSTEHLVISYDRLLGDTQQVLKTIAHYVDLEVSEKSTTYTTATRRGLGDDQDLFRSGKLDTSNVNEWHKRLANPILFQLCKAYIDSLDVSIFEKLGFDKAHTESILQDAEFTFGHKYNPLDISVAGMNLKQFFAEQGGDSTSATWFALRTQNENQKAELFNVKDQQQQTAIAQRVLSLEKDALARSLSDLAAKDVKNENEIEVLKQEMEVLDASADIYEQLATSTWVRLGNVINSPVKYCKKLWKK